MRNDFGQRFDHAIDIGVRHRREEGQRQRGPVKSVRTRKFERGVAGSIVRLPVHWNIVHLRPNSPRFQPLHQLGPIKPEHVEIALDLKEMPNGLAALGSTRWLKERTERRKLFFVSLDQASPHGRKPA